MKKRILLPFMYVAIFVFIFSCSSEITDDSSNTNVSKEEMLSLSVIVGTDEDSTTTRAVLDESNESVSFWKWEANDKLLFVAENESGQKNVITLSIKASTIGKIRGEFIGEIPVSAVVNGRSYRFFYVGKDTQGANNRSISEDDVRSGKITVDLSKQTGDLADVKRYCVLSGMGKIVVSGSTADVEGRVTLKNAFSVAHFAMKAEGGTEIDKVGIRGEGVYTSASVDLKSGVASGIEETGLEPDPEANLFLPNKKTDFYVTLVPGKVTPSFDAYYAGSYRSVVTKSPRVKDYKEEKSFVYYNNKKAVFSVSDDQKVAITNGNMQYVMPMKTYTKEMKPYTLPANNLIRWKGTTPLKITGIVTEHAGYYRLAPQQWETAMPKNSRRSGTYTYATVDEFGVKYISPETYRYFDLPSWGTVDNPTLISSTFHRDISGDGIEKEYDFGKKLHVGSKPTRTLTADEWNYLLPKHPGNLNNNRVWEIDSKEYPKWATCFIDENGDGRRGDNPAELCGYIIFPDDMPFLEAVRLFSNQKPTFGVGVHAKNNPITYEKIKNSGAVFIPLTAYRSPGNATLIQWGNHGNYFTSTFRSSGISHVRFLFDNYVNPDYSAPGQGCMSRLVQNIRK